MNINMIFFQYIIILTLLFLYIRNEVMVKKQKVKVIHLLEQQKNLNKKLKSSNNFVERRKFFRVQVFSKCNIKFLESENMKLNKLKNREFQGIIENISLGGLKFTCPLDLPIKDKINIMISFTLMEQQFNLNAQIIRKEVEIRKNFGYGVQFIDLNEDDIISLNRIINQIEIERHKKIN